MPAAQNLNAKLKAVTEGKPTAEHATTRPSISMPASASAVLAAIDPEATQPSIPSLSITNRNTSIEDFGSNSSRTAGKSDCWMRTETDLSSAS